MSEVERSRFEAELLRSCYDPFSRLSELLENMKLRIFSEFPALMIIILLDEFLDKKRKTIQCRVAELILFGLAWCI